MASRRGRAASREPTRMGVEDARPVHEASPSARAGCNGCAAWSARELPMSSLGKAVELVRQLCSNPHRPR